MDTPTRDLTAFDHIQLAMQQCDDLHGAALVALLSHVSALQSALFVKLLASKGAGTASDRLLTASEVATAMGTSVRWVYRHAAALPFSVHLNKTVRFSAHGLQEYLATQRQASYNGRS